MEALRQDLAGPDAADITAASLAVARRLQRAGTVWCAAPSWPGLAKQVAGGLVPAAAGGESPGPALRAVPDGADLVGTLRALSGSGDVLVLMATADDPAIGGLRQRAAAWGLLTVWIARGERPPAGAADYVLWDTGPGSLDVAALVAVSHRLFALALECLRNPGLLEPEQAECNEEVCITCSDEGRLGEVVGVRPDGQAEIRTPSGLETIDTTLIGDACPGDLVLVHAGAALCLVMKEAG
jgi:hypothetical protein